MANALNKIPIRVWGIVISCLTLERHSCPQRPSEVPETIARLRMCWNARRPIVVGKQDVMMLNCTPSTSRRPPSSPPKSIEIKNSRSTLTFFERYRYPVILSDNARGLLVFSCGRADLQNQALLALSTLASEQSSTGGRLEHLTHAVVGLGRALEVLVGTNLLADFLTLTLC